MITLEELEAALPPQLKGKITQEMTDHMVSVITDVQTAEQFRNNFVSFTNVLQEGKFKLESYVEAVIYVGFKLMGYTDKECYQRTFPVRYAELVAKNTSSKDIAAYVSAYNRGMLVNKIFEQSLIPTWVLNQDIYQKAINIQVEIMTEVKNGATARTKAADSLLNHLKRPENTKVELNIDIKKNDELEALEDAMRQLITNQKAMIEQGHSTQSIAHQRIIDVTPTEKNS